MAIFIKGASQHGFGAESTPGTVASTKNKWFGIQDGEWEFPTPTYEMKKYGGGHGSRDPLVQKHKELTMRGGFPTVLQHGWPIYWFLGSVTDVNNGDGTFTHQIRGGSNMPTATQHQILGDDSGGSKAIDWLGGYASQGTFMVEESGELVMNPAEALFLDFNEDVTPVPPTALERDPYLFDGATWNFYNPGTTTALTDLTTPEALRGWEYQLNNQLRPIRTQRTSKARHPIAYVPGARDHALTVRLVPAEDLTLFQRLNKDRKPFDFTYRLTRGTDDYIEWRWKDCLASDTKHNHPEEDEEIPVPLTIHPRVVEVDVKDDNATLIAAA